MAGSKAVRAVRRKPGPRGASLVKAFDAAVRHIHDQHRGGRWPNDKYADDPVGFVRDVLGESPLPHQVSILEAARDNFKVAVRSGQKTGKTKLVIWLALWWWCSFPGARVFMIAAIKDQVERVLWKELKATVRTGEANAFTLTERIPNNPTIGLVSEDGRDMRGFTVRDIEAMAGLSGKILFIVDEASHLLQEIAEAIEGNLAGGGKMVWISNPTRTEGPFFDVFNNPDKGRFWKTFHLSSEDVARYQATNGLSIPGVATLSTIAMWEEEYKRDSPFFIVRVLGDFLRLETGRVISMGDIEVAMSRWADASESGTLTFGVDPAGPGDGGDEYAICITRGWKVLALFSYRGLAEDVAIETLKGLLRSYRRGDEIPRIVLDSQGPIGASLFGRLRGLAEDLSQTKPGESFEVWGVNASNPAVREGRLYQRVREELWANASKWMQQGALPPDRKLETELHFPMWASDVSGKLKVTPKEYFRERLGRSPDRADAFLLSIWEPVAWANVTAPPPQVVVRYDNHGTGGRESLGGMNPYGGGFDPYSR